MAFTLPLLFLLVDIWPARRFRIRGLRSLVLEKIPFLALSGIAAVRTLLAQRGSGALEANFRLPVAARLANAVGVLEALVLAVHAACLGNRSRRTATIAGYAAPLAFTRISCRRIRDCATRSPSSHGPSRSTPRITTLTPIWTRRCCCTATPTPPADTLARRCGCTR
jgi:hypothetical protein